MNWIEKGLWWLAIDKEKRRVIQITKTIAPTLEMAQKILAEMAEVIESNRLQFGAPEIIGNLEIYFGGYGSMLGYPEYKYFCIH